MGHLIIYPHGLGDIILLTPALREFVKSGRQKPHVAVLKRFAGSGILDSCPWIQDCFYILPDPWNDSGGREGCMRAGREHAERLGLKPLWLWHPPRVHKVLHNFRALGIPTSSNPRTEVYIGDNHGSIVDAMSLPREFGFVQTSTGVKGLTDVGHIKDLPSEFGRKWMARQDLKNVVEVGKSFLYDDHPIPVQFEIMRRASAVCLPDSVFYHACHAMSKPVDFVYFGSGRATYDTVKPLFPVEEKVAFQLKASTRAKEKTYDLASFLQHGGLNGHFINGYDPSESGEDVWKILNLLAGKVPFAYARFNDGEMIAIVERRGVVSRGDQTVTPQLADKLTFSFLHRQRNYWKGVVCQSCYPNLFPISMKLLGNYPFVTTAVALVNRNWRTFLLECRQHLKKRRLLWIGGEDQNTNNLKLHLNISVSKTYRFPNKNTWDHYDRIKQLIAEFQAGDVVFISLGPIARVLAQEWFSIMPQATFIDIGSVFDPFTRNVWHPYQRGWHNGFNIQKRCPMCN